MSAKTIRFAAIACAVVLLCAMSGSARAGGAPEWGPGVQQNVEPDFYLTFSPTLPAVGKEIVVSVASKNGLPPNGSVRWNVSGAPFSNAGSKDGRADAYTFVPTAPGSYAITAELYGADGALISVSTLELGIGPAMTQEMIDVGSAPVEMLFDLNPSLPRVGREASFTLRYGSGIPEGCEVRWDISGGPYSGLKVGGRNQEVCAFVPGVAGSYTVKARLYAPQGFMMGEMTLQFIPMQ